MSRTEAGRPRVTYFDADRVVEVEGPEETLLGLSQRHRIPHMSECGGHARCTTCRVRCLDGVTNLSSSRRSLPYAIGVARASKRAHRRARSPSGSGTDR